MKKFINKKILIVVGFLLSIFIFLGCDDDFINNNSSGNGNGPIKIKAWKQVAGENISADSLFLKRRSFGSVVDSKNNIYVIGGKGEDNVGNLNDTWISSDGGKSWTKVDTSTTAVFSRRNKHQVVIDSKDNIYVIGGYGGDDLNDVWKTVDGGKNWTKIDTGTVDKNTLFSARDGHSAVVDSNDNIYVIAGNDGTVFLNDVWKSADGKTWEKINSSTAIFSKRHSQSAVIDNNDNMYVIGGAIFNDIWVSNDNGVNWEKVDVDSNSIFSGRYQHSAVIDNDNNMYVIAGRISNNVIVNEIWISKDKGKSWNIFETLGSSGKNTFFSERYAHASVVDNNNNIYVIGGDEGFKTNEPVILNDVWRYGY